MYIIICGIVTIVALIVSLIFDAKLNSGDDSLTAYTLLGAFILWVLVGCGYWTSLN